MYILSITADKTSFMCKIGKNGCPTLVAKPCLSHPVEKRKKNYFPFLG
jgi:hypothetical protein